MFKCESTIDMLIVTVALFILLQPGLLFTLVRGNSRSANIKAILLHALIFAVILLILKDINEGFKGNASSSTAVAPTANSGKGNGSRYTAVAPTANSGKGDGSRYTAVTLTNSSGKGVGSGSGYTAGTATTATGGKNLGGVVRR